MKKRRLLVAGMVLSLIAFPALPVFGHASLAESSPGDGEVVDAAPADIRLEFTEPVAAPVAAVRIFDSAGRRVDEGAVDRVGEGTTLVAPISALEDGTYVVAWRVVSSDGHPVFGAFLFHVGAPGSSIDQSLLDELLGDGVTRGFAIAGWGARWLAYAATLGAVGAFTFSSWVDVRSRRPRILSLIRATTLIGAVAVALQVPLLASEATGLGFEAWASGRAWADAWSSPVGFASLLALAGFGLLAAGAAKAAPAGWAGAILLLAALAISGHTVTTEPVTLTVVADVVHSGAGAVWFGGLAAMFLSYRSAHDEDDLGAAAATLGRFSRLAAATLVAVSMAGVGLAWALVRSPSALVSTTYGWTLLVKVGLVGVVVAAATYNNRILVPRLVGSPPDRAGWRRLSRTVRAEAIGLVAVLAVTASLANLQPASEAAGVSGPFSTFVSFDQGQLNLVVDPNRAGHNEVHLYFLTPGGLPVVESGPVTLEMRLPAEDIGPIVREALFAGPGHFLHAGSELAIPGRWEITVRQRRAFEEEAVTVAVTVNR